MPHPVPTRRRAIGDNMLSFRRRKKERPLGGGPSDRGQLAVTPLEERRQSGEAGAERLRRYRGPTVRGSQSMHGGKPVGGRAILGKYLV